MKKQMYRLFLTLLILVMSGYSGFAIQSDQAEPSLLQHYSGLDLSALTVQHQDHLTIISKPLQDRNDNGTVNHPDIEEEEEEGSEKEQETKKKADHHFFSALFIDLVVLSPNSAPDLFFALSDCGPERTFNKTYLYLQVFRI